jgi:drug/metabolite transporter (DMT)-like permease
MASMKYIEASKASITATLEPVVASLLAYVILGEIIEWPQLIGVGLVLTGIIVLQFSPRLTQSKQDLAAR